LVLNVTFSYTSAMSWRPVLVLGEAGVPGENNRPWASNWTHKISYLCQLKCMYQGRKKEKPCICVLGVSILHLFLMVSYKNLELMGCCGKLHSLRGEYGYFKEMCFIQILLCPYKVRNSYNDLVLPTGTSLQSRGFTVLNCSNNRKWEMSLHNIFLEV
jgi:hypothetical protein